MEERDNTPLLDLNVSLDETMLDKILDCVPHCDTEIYDHMLDENGDLVEISNDMATDYIPKVGMLFESEDELYQFYNYYARRTGFSIRKGHFQHSSDDEIRKRIIHCSKEGFKQRHKRGTPQKERSVFDANNISPTNIIIFCSCEIHLALSKLSKKCDKQEDDLYIKRKHLSLILVNMLFLGI
ncbi:hypothetical protein MKX03_016122 [Papaver bracteatum]|nr:hypothetical protein MKX03_016122 [Papaver bracteatum]